MSFARTMGMTGLFAALLGATIVVVNEAGGQLLQKNMGAAAVVVGLMFMVFHAARETDVLVRRVYGYLGGLGSLGVSILVSLIPVFVSALQKVPEGEVRVIRSLFFPYGVVFLLSGWAFLFLFSRAESAESHRKLIGVCVTVAAVACLLLGVIGSFASSSFGLTYGSTFSVVALLFGATAVNHSGGPDLGGRRTAVVIGVIGSVVFLAALVRSVIPGLRPFFVPTGLILMAIGLIYAAVSVSLTSDRAVVVLFRREMSAYFYSPVAYVVLVMFALISWIGYFSFWDRMKKGFEFSEPIVGYLIFDFVTILPPLIAVPAITMRLFSEEKRSGTFEVLACSPVDDVSIVVSKVAAAFVFYMVSWLTTAYFLLVIRLENGTPFDYRPLLTFYLAVAVTGLTFVSMGVFASALTRNQIIAAVVCFGGMIAYFSFYFLAGFASTQWQNLFRHLSFINLWRDALLGNLHLRDVVLQGSQAVFWCFLSVKVLESRRWS